MTPPLTHQVLKPSPVTPWPVSLVCLVNTSSPNLIFFWFNLRRNGKEHDDNFLVNMNIQSGDKNNNFQPIKLATHIYQEVIVTLFAITPQIESEWRLQDVKSYYHKKFGFLIVRSNQVQYPNHPNRHPFCNPQKTSKVFNLPERW